MTCPNCGLANAEGAKFCSNCGTVLGAAPAQTGTPYPSQSQYQGAPPPYQQPGPYNQMPVASGGGRNSVGKNIGIGCLILIALFLFFGLSCTRACFGHRTVYMHRRW